MTSLRLPFVASSSFRVGVLSVASTLGLAAGVSAGCTEGEREQRRLPGVTSTTTTNSTGSGGGGGQGGDGALPLHCVNLELDADETDVDCGGSCEPCPAGANCAVDDDCISMHCASGVCAEPTCDDAIANGDESDVDCGGTTCGKCDNGKACRSNGDCVVDNCVDGTCAAPACDDLVHNGAETDVDCGGGACPPCGTGKACLGSADCESSVCTDNVCQSSNCGNGLKDPEETDVDCGGICAACEDNQACLVDGDCQSHRCENDVCAAPTCVDQIANGDETDVDCGGAFCGACADGDGCVANKDCVSGVCGGNVCAAPACDDGVKNGTETDLDCGGPCPSPCPLGQGCSTNSDCVTDICKGNVCECPAKMVTMPKVGMGAYCVDQTEVSYNDYSAFLDASPPVGNQIPECQWNPSYAPLANWPPAPAELGYPVTDIDWCDAYAYCAYYQKHLCGKVGGGANAFADLGNATLSEWYNACSFQSVNTYPYGDVVQPYCDGGPTKVQNEAQQFAVVPSTCQGGQINLFHMAGNLAEWENSCNGASGSTDDCRLRGGSFVAAPTGTECAAPAQAPRNHTAADIGFRCCL